MPSAVEWASGEEQQNWFSAYNIIEFECTLSLPITTF